MSWRTTLYNICINRKLKFPVAKAIPIVIYQWDDHKSMAEIILLFNFRSLKEPQKCLFILSDALGYKSGAESGHLS